MGNNLYTTLGVSPGATETEIRAAYRSRMRDVHPDRATDAADRARRTARSAAVNGAYDVLSDATKRAAYDLEQAAAPARPAPAPVAPTPRFRLPALSLRPRLSDLVALPASFVGYLALPIVSPGTTSLAGAAWGAILAIVATRLAAGDGQLTDLADRLRRR